MKIVHVLPALTKGGGERVAVELANHAAATGHEVAIIAGFGADPRLLADRIRPEIEVRCIAPAGASRARRYAAGAAWVVRNWRWLSSRDLLHCHLSYGAAFGSAVYNLRKLTRQGRPAVVETYHAVGMPIPAANRWILARLAAQRDGLALMAEDPFWARFLSDRPNLPSELILNGVSAPRVLSATEARAYRRRIGLADDAGPVVGTIGAMRPERRTEDLAAIFAAVAAKVPLATQFLIGGDGVDRTRVENFIARTGMQSRIHLLGLVEDPAEPLALMDLYVTLNVGPVTGLAAMEAALAGVPVVALQLQKDYRSTDADWIWSSPDPDEVAERVQRLLENGADRRALARRQQAYARTHHSIEAMADAYARLYRRALVRAGAARERSS